MSDPRERDDIFRNRIADALRWSEENSDAAIERELAEIEAAPLRDDEVSRILSKTGAMRAEMESVSPGAGEQSDSAPSPFPGERVSDASARLSGLQSPSSAGETGHESPTPAFGEAEMKTTNPRVRPAVNHTQPGGSSSVLAIVTSCVCLVAALGLFRAADVGKSGSRTRPAVSAGSNGASTGGVTEIAALAADLYPDLLKPQKAKVAPVQRVKVGDVIETLERERRRVTLPDGSVLFVNQKTVAKIESPRKVRVDSGEVYVEAVPQNLLAGELRRKFVIEAPDRTVTALGTKFAVKTTAEKQTEVLVTQGEVAASGIEVSLPSGRELVASDRFARLPVTTASPGTQTATGTDAAGGQSERAEVAASLVVQQAPRVSEALSWTRELMAARILPIVPPSQHRGGSLIVVDSEGQEMRLSLRKFHIDVHIEDGFARTTIDQTYFNHTQSRQEGTFHFPLPPDASLSRLAMYVNGRLMEGGMAERDHARNTFEEIVRSMKDPALLEWVDGSTFKMRVFPLEPRQEKRIVMSYTQRLSNDYGKETYRFPAGHNLNRVRDWSTRVRVPGGANLEWDSPSHFLKARKSDGDLVLEGEAQRVTIKDDLVVELTDPVQKRMRTSTRFSMAEHEGQQYLMLRMRPDLGEDLDQQRRIRNYIFLFESSGDRDPILARVQVDLIRTFLENAEHEDTFAIVRASSKAERFSVRPVPCVKKQIRKAVDFMEDSHLLGALDLEAAFEMCGRLKSRKAENWLVHVGSGIPAIGERDATQLQRLLPKKTRYVGVGIGKRWNRPFMKTAAGRTGGHFDQINPDEKIGWRAFELFSTLKAPRLLDLKVMALQENKDDRDPQFLNFADTIAHGQELCAVTRIPGDEELPESLLVTGLLNGREYRQTVKVKNVAKHADYLPRSWSRLEIDRLVSLGANEHKDTIISLSKAMYVMSPFTSLLVLENEEMYEKYNIDRGRKDHWALYGAPPQIKVVHEPVMGPRPNASPVEIRERLKAARAERDEIQADLSLAERDERPEKVLQDLEDQLRQRAAHVDSLARQLEQHERSEKDTLQKLAQTVVRRKPQFAGQPLVWNSDSGISYTGFGRDFSTEELRRRRQRLLLRKLNSRGLVNPELESRIAQYEMAYRMQPGYVLTVTDFDSNGLSDDLMTIVPQTDGRFLGVNWQWGQTGYGDDWLKWRDNGQIVSHFDVDPAFNLIPGPILPQLNSLEGIDRTALYYLPQSTVSGEPLKGIRIARRFDATFRGGYVNDRDGYLDDYGLWSRPVLAPRLQGRNTDLMTRLREEADLGEVPSRDPVRIEEDYRRLSGLSRLSGRPQVRLTRELAEAVPDLVLALKQPVEVKNIDELGTIIIHGNQSDVSSVMAVIDHIEVARQPMADSTVRVIPLQVSRQDEVAQALESLLTARKHGDSWRIEESIQRVEREIIRRTDRREMFLGEPMQELFERERLPRDYHEVSQLIFLRPPGLLPDLTELMPGLQTLPADQLAVIEAEGGDKVTVRRGRIDDRARDLIERARRTGWQHVTVNSLSASGGPVTVSINGAGKFRYDLTLPSGLKETVLCDGEFLWHLYPELGLGAKRPMSRFHREAMKSLFPWAVHPAEDLAVGSDVRFVNERTIELVPLRPRRDDDAEEQEGGKTIRRAVIVRLVFGDDGRLAEKQLVIGKKRDLVLRTVFGRDGQVKIVGPDGRDVTSWKIARTESHSIDLTPPTDGLVILPLPYRSMDHVQPLLEQKNAYTAMSEEDALKVMASWFAAGNYGSLTNLINERYIKRNDNRLGFLTMISVWTTHNTSVQPVFTSRKDPLAQFLIEYYDWRNFRNPNIEFTQSDKLPPFVQEFVRSHNLFTLWYSGRATKDRTRAQIGAELTRTLAAIGECPREEFRWKLLQVVHGKIRDAQLMEGDFGRRLAAELKPFETSEQYAGSAPYARIIWLLEARETKGVGRMYRELLVDVAERGGAIILSDEIHKLFKQRLKGHREWTAAVKTVANVLKKNRGPAALMGLAEQLRTLEETELANAFYSEALIDLKPDADPRRLQLLYGYVRRAEDWERAEEYIFSMLQDEELSRQPALWREAAEVANNLGHLDESLRRLEHALNLEFQNLPEAVELKSFRTAYGNLFDQYKALADKYERYDANQVRSVVLPEDLLTRVQKMADRWRTIDPDDTDVCGRAARIASQLGEEDLAWSYWTTPLAENPGDSEVWRNLAREMGARSSTELASRAFQQAFEIESTNPEILYEHAMMLKKAGREEAAKKKLKEIVGNPWGRKFNSTRSRAGKALQESP